MPGTPASRRQGCGGGRATLRLPPGSQALRRPAVSPAPQHGRPAAAAREVSGRQPEEGPAAPGRVQPPCPPLVMTQAPLTQHKGSATAWQPPTLLRATSPPCFLPELEAPGKTPDKVLPPSAPCTHPTSRPLLRSNLLSAPSSSVLSILLACPSSSVCSFLPACPSSWPVPPPLSTSSSWPLSLPGLSILLACPSSSVHSLLLACPSSCPQLRSPAPCSSRTSSQKPLLWGPC